MTIVLLIWLTLCVLEAYRNYRIIKIKKLSPDHVKATVLRLGVAAVLWIASPLVFDIPYDSWLALPLVDICTFAPVFNASLNLMRGEKIYYLGEVNDPEEDSKLDTVLKRYEFPVFFFECLLGGASILTYYVGLNAIFG